jgi:DHA3 family tetracycline resistance protein-like MFS transporter
LSGSRSRLSAYTVYLILQGAYALFFATIVTINLVYQVEMAHLNPLQLVLVGTVLETTALVGQVPTGALADVYGRRRAVVAGILLTGAGFILEGAIPRFGAIALAQVIWGAGATLQSGAEEAWIAGEVDEARLGHVFLRGTQVGQIGTLIGAVASVALGSVQLNLPIVVGGALFIALGVFLAFAMPEQGFQPARRAERDSWRAMGATLRRSGQLVRRSPILLTILAVAAFFGMSGEGFDRLQTAHFLHDLTLPSLGPFKPVVWFGVMTVGGMLLSIIAAEIVRRRLDTNNHAALARTLFALNALQVASMVVFGLAGSFPLALAAFWSISLLRRTGNPIYNTWLAQSIDPSLRATVISASGLVDAFGQIAGGPAIGAIGTVFSLRAALVTAGAVLAPALPLFARAARLARTAGVLVTEEVGTTPGP